MMTRLPVGGLGIGAITSSAGLGSRAVLQAVYLILLSRWLGAEAYGMFAGSVSAAILLSPIAGWGMGYVFMEQVARRRVARRALWSMVVTQVLFTGVIVAAVLVGTTVIGLSVRVSVLQMTLLASAELIALPLAQLATATLLMNGHPGLAAMSTCAVPGARVMGALAFILLAPKISLSSIIFSHFFGSVLGASAALVGAWLINCQNSESGESGEHPRRGVLLREGAPYAGAAFTGISYMEIDKVLMLQILDARVTGAYMAAFRVVSVFAIPVSALLANALPRLLSLGSSKKELILIRRVVASAVAYSLLAALFVYLMAPLIPALLGSDFQIAIPLLATLAIWLPLAALHQCGATALIAAGGKSSRMIVETAGIVLIVILNLWLLPRIGAYGAIVALIVAELQMAIGCWILLSNYRKRASKSVGSTA